jgi:hypothetical protein
MYLTHNQRERDSATAFSMSLKVCLFFFSIEVKLFILKGMGLEVFGVFLAAMIQGVMISIYGTFVSCNEIKNLSSNNLTLDSFNNTSLQFNLNPSPVYNKLVYIF